MRNYLNSVTARFVGALAVVFVLSGRAVLADESPLSLVSVRLSSKTSVTVNYRLESAAGVYDAATLEVWAGTDPDALTKVAEKGVTVGVTTNVVVTGLSPNDTNYIKLVAVGTGDQRATVTSDAFTTGDFQRRPTMPEGYVPLEYVESAGSAYINTGYSSSQHVWEYEYDAELVSNDRRGGAQIRMEFTASVAGGIRRHIRVYSTDAGQYNVYLDDTEKSVASGGASQPGHYINKTIYVMAVGGDGLPQSPSQSGRLYWYVLRRDSVKLREFFPARNPSGVVGLYDAVSGTFFASSTSTAFVGGPEATDFVEAAPIPTQYLMDGQPCTPDLVVSNRTTGAILVKGTDYTLAYTNNTLGASGTPAVKIVGCGSYAGQVRTVLFSVVNPAAITSLRPSSRTTLVVNYASDPAGGVFADPTFYVAFGTNAAALAHTNVHTDVAFAGGFTVTGLKPAQTNYVQLLVTGANGHYALSGVPQAVTTGDFERRPVLPEGYTPVDYVEANGSSWIRTGYTSLTGVDDDYAMDADLVSNNRVTGARTRLEMEASLGGGRRRHMRVHITPQALVTTYVDYLDVACATTQLASVSTYNSKEIRVLSSGADQPQSPMQNGKLYWMTLVRNGTLVRAYSPVVNPNGVAGLWDSVSSNFYPSAGSEPFTAGPVVTPFVESAAISPTSVLDDAPACPSVTVLDTDTLEPLVAGQDYDLVYSNNTAGGTAYAIIRGRVGTRFAGYERVVPFTAVAPVEALYVKPSAATSATVGYTLMATAGLFETAQAYVLWGTDPSCAHVVAVGAVTPGGRTATFTDLPRTVTLYARVRCVSANGETSTSGAIPFCLNAAERANNHIPNSDLESGANWVNAAVGCDLWGGANVGSYSGDGFIRMRLYQGATREVAYLALPAGTYTFCWSLAPYATTQVNPQTTTATLVPLTGSAITLDVFTSRDRVNDRWYFRETTVTVPSSGLYKIRLANSSSGNIGNYVDDMALVSATPANFALDPLEDRAYLGERLTPSVIARDLATGDVLKEGEDYDLLYGTNVTAGTQGFVSAIGKGDYHGVATVNFRLMKPIRVSAAATGGGSGESWASAKTFAEGLAAAAASSVPCELWIAGSNVLTSASTISGFSSRTIFRGGFNGTETCAEDRAEGAVSYVDGSGTADPVSCTSYKRLCFERLVFVNAKTRAVSVSGFDDVRFTDCRFVANGLAGGGAVKLYGSRSDTIKSRDAFERCSFVGNASVGTDATGAGAYLERRRQTAFQSCLFETNGVSTGKGTTKGAALYAKDATICATECDFVGNRTISTSGAAVWLEGGCGGQTFTNCLWLGNADAGLYAGLSSAALPITIDHATFAYNTSRATGAAAGLVAACGKISVRNSIFYGNANGAGATAGADISCAASGPTRVDYALFRTNSESCVTFATLGDGVRFDDPLFVSSNDVHLLSYKGYFDATGGVHKATGETLSPAIDAADPSSDYSHEGLPNGGCANLGRYGNTAFASLTPELSPEVDGPVTVEWPFVYSQPRIGFTMGGEGSYTATAVAYISTNGTDWTFASDTLSGLKRGDARSVLFPVYFIPGSRIWVKVRVSASGNVSDSEVTESTVPGVLPPWYGKKGPANVIHVRPDATGRGDGTSWTDAADFATACNLVTAEKNELWIAGTNVLTATAKIYTFAVPVTVRGGFTGVECAEIERAKGAVSVLDGADAYDIFNFYNDHDLYVENLIFMRGAYRGMKKFSSSGNLTVSNCAFSVNGRLGTWEQELGYDVHEIWRHGGAGLSVYGNGAARVRVLDCRFEGNTTSTGTNYNTRVRIGNGGGAFFGVCASAVVDGCTFVTNRPGAWVHTGGQAQALLFEETSFALTNCVFVGHTGSAVGVRKTAETVTNRMVNCRFIANKGAFFGSRSIANPFAIENCTFAFNYGDAAFQLNRGTADVKNSIFWNIGPDMSFANSSAATLDYTLVGGTNTTWFGTGATFGEHMLIGVDPLFVSSTNEVCTLFNIKQLRSNSPTLPDASELVKLNVHLRGRSGYVDERTGRLVKFHQKSPAIDAGDPESDYSHELETRTTGNGKRVNLGAYGNTPWATMSPIPGAFLRVR